MTTILPSARSPLEAIMEQVGSGLSQTLPSAVKEYSQRQNLQKSLEAVKGLTNNPKATDLDIMLAAMQAGAGIPGSERYMAALIPELTKAAAVNRSLNIKRPSETNPTERTREPVEAPSQRGPLPNFMNQQNQADQFFPTNMGPQGGPGSAPQMATNRTVVPLRSPQQILQDARKYQKDANDAGDKISFADAKKVILDEEEDKKVHNKDVGEENKARIKSQTDYGKKAVDELTKVYPEATSEMQAIFKKKGEEASKSGDSEADIDRYLAKEATKFKNAISNVKKEMSSPRLQNMFQRKALGNYKDFEKSGADLRSHIQPLLDLGLYDTARNLLTDLGYYPEEREMIINPLSEKSKSIMARVPEVRVQKSLGKQAGIPGIGLAVEREPVNIDNIKSGLMEMKQADPNFSLVLARKAFEDKHYDWRSYKDALNQLEQEGFELTDDQKIQKGILDSPPLNRLEQILHGLNIIGR